MASRAPLLCLFVGLLVAPWLAFAHSGAESAAPQASTKWQARYAALGAALRGAHPDLIFLGDSSFRELQNPSPRFGDIDRVWRRYYACRGGFGLGFAGDTTGNLLWRVQQGELAGQAPKLVVILIGTTDIAVRGGASPDEAAAGIRAVVAATHAAVPRARLLLLGLLPREKFNRKRRAVNRALAGMDWAGLGARYRDPGLVLALPNGRPDPADFRETALGKPMLNPNAAGWAKLAAAIEPEIGAALGRPPCRGADGR